MSFAMNLLEQEPLELDVGSVWQNILEQIHDGPLQELSAADLRLAALKRLDRPVRREDLEELTDLVKTAIEQLRLIVSEGYAQSDEPDLHARLDELAAAFSAETGIHCRYDVEPEHLRLGQEVGAALYRAVRELLVNVRKHSSATRVSIDSAERQDGSIELVVADNGIGLPPGFAASPASSDSASFGLWSIEHRLGSFGIAIEIDGTSGFTARLIVPRSLLRR
jgi:signal transduction histidine kinase